MTQKHTPTPWSTDIQKPYGAAILDSKGVKIGFCSPMIPRQVLGGKPTALPFADNAKLIVYAVNAVSIYEEALEKLARLGNGNILGNSDGNMIAREALAKAKGA